MKQWLKTFENWRLHQETLGKHTNKTSQNATWGRDLSSIPSNFVGYLYSNLQAIAEPPRVLTKAPHQSRVSGTTLRCVEFLTSISSYTKKGAGKRAASAMKQSETNPELQRSAESGFWRCLMGRFRLAPKHSRIFKNIQEYSRIFKNIQEYSRIRRIQKRRLIFRPLLKQLVSP